MVQWKQSILDNIFEDFFPRLARFYNNLFIKFVIGLYYMYAAVNLLNLYIGINIFPTLKMYFIVFRFLIIICKMYIYKLLFKILCVKHDLYIRRNMQLVYSTPNNSCKWWDRQYILSLPLFSLESHSTTLWWVLS